MKKNFFFAALAVSAMTGITMTSCSEEKNYYDPNAHLNELKQKYVESFEQRYGAPAASQAWGFGAVEPIDTAKLTTKGGTRAANPNSNQWHEFVEVPAPLTEAEKKHVYEYFRAHSKDAEGIQTFSMTDYFVLQAWKGVEEYKDANGTTVVASRHMDKLSINGDHVLDFNNTSSSANGGMMLMQNTLTKDFAYNNSLDGQMHYEYKLLEVPGYGYFVGFDFCATGANPNQQVERDGIYTDGIVKIVPAVYKNAHRVMCEDLGTTDDFDFNDVVFDVAFLREYWPVNGTFAIITLQAAGGTMPLFIDGKEVHELFGVQTSDMINTGHGRSKAPVMWREQVTSTDPNDIVITVNGEKAGTYTLTSEKGKVPYKICVPASVAWTDEKENIEAKYPKFPEWVKDPSKPFWE